MCLYTKRIDLFLYVCLLILIYVCVYISPFDFDCSHMKYTLGWSSSRLLYKSPFLYLFLFRPYVVGTSISMILLNHGLGYFSGLPCSNGISLYIRRHSGTTDCDNDGRNGHDDV